MQAYLENHCKDEGTLQHEELHVNGEVLLQTDCFNGEKVMYMNLSGNNTGTRHCSVLLIHWAPPASQGGHCCYSKFAGGETDSEVSCTVTQLVKGM